MSNLTKYCYLLTKLTLKRSAKQIMYTFLTFFSLHPYSCLELDWHAACLYIWLQPESQPGFQTNWGANWNSSGKILISVSKIKKKSTSSFLWNENTCWLTQVNFIIENQMLWYTQQLYENSVNKQIIYSISQKGKE